MRFKGKKLKIPKINKTSSINEIIELYNAHATAVNISERSAKFPFFLYKMPYRSLMVKILNPKENESILDLGCGDGFYLEMLSRFSSKIIGLDISSIRVARCGRIAWVIKGDAIHLPFKSNILEKIIMADVLEHLLNPEAAIKECWRVLKKGGVAVVSLPTRLGDLMMKIGSFFPFNIFISEKFTSAEHLHHFNCKKLKKILKKNGFSINITKYFPIPLIATNIIFLLTKK